MRRFFALSTTAIILVACAAPSSIPSQEVLRRSTAANQELLSARFTVEASFTLPPFITQNALEGTLNAQGDMQDGGRQINMSLTSKGESQNPEKSSWDIATDIIVIDENETYTKIDRLDITPVPAILSGSSIFSMIGTWWALPSSTGAVKQSGDITPDPQMLRMQTEAIDVVTDHGITSTDGFGVHHLDVTFNKEKLASFLRNSGEPSSDIVLQQLAGANAVGELWIDAETYVLRRAEWTITGDATFPVALELSVNIRDHNQEIVISPPSSARLWPIETLSPLLTPSLPPQPNDL
jgi:hypothetical protein